MPIKRQTSPTRVVRKAFLLAQVAQQNPFEAPEAMIDNVLSNFIEEYRIPEDQHEEFRNSQREGAIQLVKRAIILDSVANDKEFVVSDDDVDAAVVEGIEDDKEKSRALRNARKAGQMERIRHRLRERKALDFLLENAEIEEVRGPRPEIPQDSPSEAS